MDIFAAIMLGSIVLLVLCLLVLGAKHPRSGADVLDWKPTRSPELEAQLELDDLDQMLEAQNERRRQRGERELDLEQIELRVAEDQREVKRLRDSYAAENADHAELAEMLAHANAGRRRKGLPELTLEQLRAEVEGPSPES